MSIDVAEYKRFKSKVDLIRQEGDREKGALDATRKRIVEEFGCKTLDEAKELEAKIRKEAEELEVQYNDSMENFKKQWKEQL